MYFHNWLKRKGKPYGYVSNIEVLDYLKGKDHPVADQLRKECIGLEHAAGIRTMIPIAVWKDEYYNFKS